VVKETAPVKAPPTPQLTLSVTSFGLMAEPVKLVGVLAVKANGVLPVLSRQKVKEADATVGTRLVKFMPLTGPSPASEHVCVRPICKAAVADAKVLFWSVTVFDCSCANVTPPTSAATAPIVPIARAIGLIL